MKRVIFLAWLCFFLVPTAWAQEKCEAPVWNVGDKWTYKLVTGDTLTHEVIEIKQESYILKMEGGDGPNLIGYDKSNMNVRFLIEEGGRQVESDNPLRKLFDFPISVGKKWSDATSSYVPLGPNKRGKALFEQAFKVVGFEEIAISAGKLKAYKIHFAQTHQASRNSGWIRFWYSPEAKNWIKREVEKGPFWKNAPWAKDAELVSYTLK